MYTGTSLNKIYSRLETSKGLAPYLATVSDFSKMRMADRISQSVENLATANQYMSQLGLGAGAEGIYALDMSMRNYDSQAKARDFAAGAAASTAKGGFEGVRGVDVIDLTLIATVQSMIPTMAVDFGMQKPTDVITYQKLVAVDEHGQILKEEDVVNPYRPLNWKARTSMNDAALTAKIESGSGVISKSLGAPVAPGTVKVVYGGITGEDMKGDGVIYWLGKSKITAEVVDYTTGTLSVDVTGETLSASNFVQIDAKADMGADSTGATTLRLKPAPEKITVDAVQHAVQLENNIESISFMNKQVMGKNYGEIATRQMLDAFIYTLNTEVAREVLNLVEELKALPDENRLKIVELPVLDLSEYYAATSFTQFSITKDDRVLDYINQLELKMQERSDKGFTYILAGSKAARIFMSNPKFKSIPAQLAKMDGVMGYLDLGYTQIAIVKHQIVDYTYTSDPQNAHFFIGYKDPNGLASNVGYFEYLPICSTKVALNYMQPTQFSQSVFNYSTAHSLIKEYTFSGTFKVTA